MKKLFVSNEKSRKLNIFSILLMCFILIFETMVVFADPSTTPPTDEEIDEAKNERDQTQQELNEVKASIEELSDEKASVEDEIDEVSSALVQVLAEIDVIEQNISDKELEIAQAEIDYAAAVEVEKAQYEAMKIRIQYLYENGNADLLSIYFESGTITEALNKADYIEELYTYDRKMLAEYQTTVQTVNELHETLLAEKDELLDLQADYEEEQSYMEEVMEELQGIVDDYESQLASAKSLANEYSQKIKNQNREIKRLETEKKKAEEEARRKAEEEARRKAEEEARRLEEEARRNATENATNEVASAQDTGVIVTTNNNAYDVSSIYSANGSDLGKSLAAYACQFIGNPYVPGGTSLTNGADCSGFVFSVYKSFGYKVPRTSSSLRSAGVEVSYENAQPGDVVCYPGHVGIYIGNGMIVHASTQKTGIKVSKAQYRSILCVRRLL